MPMLGDILAAARNSSGAFQGWLERSHPELAGELASAAAAACMTPTAYVRAAISDFNRFAPEEDWATLTSSLRDSDDPGTVCLLAMIDWRLNVVACGEHSHRSSANHREGKAMAKNNDPSADAPLNPALKSETESVYPTKERSPSPYESTSTKANDGGGWPIIWLVVTAVCIALAIYFLV